jgi:undecaprenyl-diphosphatase
MDNEYLQAIILGIVQGLTEFLPVSSSGHLELGKGILDWEGEGEESMLMTVALHAATALSTIVVFWKDILEITKNVLKFKWNDETKFCAMIAVSMVPAAFVGIVFEEQIAKLFDKQILLVGVMLLVTGTLLIFADRAKNTSKTVTFPAAAIIGIAQAIAILPGISRSGATISTSVLLGIDRTRAARFSFLMVVPLIMGKMAKDLSDGAFSDADVAVLPLLLGFVAAFLTGWLACKWMISMVRGCKLWTFSIYCTIVGAAAIIYTI